MSVESGRPVVISGRRKAVEVSSTTAVGVSGLDSAVVDNGSNKSVVNVSESEDKGEKGRGVDKLGEGDSVWLVATTDSLRLGRVLEAVTTVGSSDGRSRKPVDSVMVVEDGRNIKEEVPSSELTTRG